MDNRREDYRHFQVIEVAGSEFPGPRGLWIGIASFGPTPSGNVLTPQLVSQIEVETWAERLHRDLDRVKEEALEKLRASRP
jgi:hypothetical protein